MKLILTKKKTNPIKVFTESEWAIADTEHFGRPSRWVEEDAYLRAEENGKILGVLHYSFKAGVMEIETVIVSNERKREGIGTLLMQRAESEARRKGLHKLYLITGKGWSSIKFYKKLGFIQTGELKKHFLGKDWLEFTKFMN